MQSRWLLPNCDDFDDCSQWNDRGPGSPCGGGNGTASCHSRCLAFSAHEQTPCAWSPAGECAADTGLIRGRLRNLYWLHFLWAVATAVLALLHFPKEPPSPPSLSSAKDPAAAAAFAAENQHAPALLAAPRGGGGGGGGARDPLLAPPDRDELGYFESAVAGAGAIVHNSPAGNRKRPGRGKKRGRDGCCPEALSGHGAANQGVLYCELLHNRSFVLLIFAFGISAGE
jgi:hypothetical protein